jgi:hypothetical protein
MSPFNRPQPAIRRTRAANGFRPQGRPDCRHERLVADPDLAPVRGRADYADLLSDVADTPAAAKP